MSPVRERLLQLGIASLLLALGVSLAAFTWRAWPDVVVDFGRELYVPWRLAAGERLYADVAYFNGPLSPYWNALLFGVFGVGLSTLAFANLALLALVTLLLYRQLRRLGGRLAATAGAVVFLVLFAFAQFTGIGNYNFVCPYSHELTHGFLLSLVSLGCLGRFAERARGVWLVLAGACLGLVFLTKAELFLADLVALGAGLSLWLRARPEVLRRSHGPWACAAALLVPALAVVTVAWGLLALGSSGGMALRGILGSWPEIVGGDAASLPFYRERMGLDAPLENLSRMAAWLAAWTAMALGGAVLALAVGGLARRAPRAAWLGGPWGAALAAAAAFAALALARDDVGWLEGLRPLPVFLLGAALATWLPFERAVHEPRERARWVLQGAWIAFALALLPKQLLNPRISHYGFVLALPGALLVVVLLCAWIPRWLDARGAAAGAAARGLAVGLLAGALWGHLPRLELQIAERKDFVLERGADTIRTDRYRGPVVERALLQIEQALGPDQTLLALPEGIVLNYLARRRAPTRYVNFMPPEMVMYGEEEILKALRRSPPDAVVLVHKKTAEYGLPYFGTDYGERIHQWVARHYRGLPPIGGTPLDPRTSFGIQVLFRREQ